jgi:hypothetical protein
MADPVFRRSISQSELRAVLNYSPETGIFTWLKPHRKVKAGDVAGSRNSEGYLQIKINGRMFKAHRLALIYMTGTCPPFVDHRDRCFTNNSWTNLREATRGENNMNCGIRKDNTSGYKGVYETNGNGPPYVALIGYKGKSIYLGHFHDAHEAHKAAMAARIKYYGEFVGEV